MKLIVSSKKDVNQDKDGESVPKLESVEVVLVHCKYYLLLYLLLYLIH